MYNLEESWNSLIKKYTSDIDVILNSYNAIVKKYNLRFRYYHNLNHITDMLILADKYKSQINDFDSFQFAIWFHDIIYKTYRNDNEEKSALFAFNFLNNIGVSKINIDNTTAMILLTKKHNISESENKSDYKLFLDIDLAILGTDREKYTEYIKNVRKEYFYIPGIIYNKSRIKLLSGFLNRDFIFLSNSFQNEYENTARQNISYEIDLLS